MALDEFLPAHGLKGVFGVVKLWPKMQVAEDEVIARLKVAAEKIGARCVEITPDGKYLGTGRYAERDELDFAIHLHFETPKAYDLHSLVALWNPLEFYYIMRPGVGYRPFSENIVSHDDFLSCGSKQADDHVRRQLKNGRPGPDLTMYHSLAEPIIAPSLGEKKIFYVGINWERVGGRKSRHQDILNLLDDTGTLRIHGPEKVNGIRVWEDFKSYIGPIPFDGSSVIERIAEAGIVLVLSSDAHKDAEMMSNRLFEGLAAGAVIISDENPFSRRHFGDDLLYVDTTKPAEETANDILAHVEWVRSNPNEAKAMAERAQARFKSHYTMDRSLNDIYRSLPERKDQTPPLPSQPLVTAYLLLPEFSEKGLQSQLRNARSQDYQNMEYVLVVDELLTAADRTLLNQRVADAGGKLRIQNASFYRPGAGKQRKRRPLGHTIHALHQAAPDGAYMLFVEEGERLFHDHVQRLLPVLLADDMHHTVFGSVTVQRDRKEDSDPMLVAMHHLPMLSRNLLQPVGTGRFLIRKHESQGALDSVLPYMRVKPMAAFALDEKTPSVDKITQLTLLNETQLDDPNYYDAVGLDNEILMDILPSTMRGQPMAEALSVSGVLAPEQFSLHNLKRSNKLQIIKDLFEELPIPLMLQKFVLHIYHLLSRRR